MCARWILLAYILHFNLKTITPQYYDSEFYRNMPVGYYDHPRLRDARDEADMFWQRGEHRPKYSEEYETDSSEFYAGLRHGNRRKVKKKRCACSCNKCKPRPKPCCRQVCYYCRQTPPTYNNYQNQRIQQNNPDEDVFIFVPYSLPIVIPNMFN